MIGFGFRQFGLRKKLSVSVSESLVSEKSPRFSFGKFGIGKKVSISDLIKILVPSLSESHYILEEI